MRQCKICLETKPLEQYYKGHKSYCKKCSTAKTRQYFHDNKEIRLSQQKDYYEKHKTNEAHVYILPKENYAGVTKNIKFRMYVHKDDGNDTTGYRVLYSTPQVEEAFELESLLHDLGYEGRHTNNMQHL